MRRSLGHENLSEPAWKQHSGSAMFGAETEPARSRGAGCREEVAMDSDYTDINPAGSAPGGPVEQTEANAKRLFYAGIGAFAAACDAAEDTFDRFVNRGEQVTQEWQARADDIRTQNAGKRGRVRDYVRSAMDSMLNTVDIPSKTDVDTINLKLNVLTRKIDDLQMATMSEGPTSVETPPPPPEHGLAT